MIWTSNVIGVPIRVGFIILHALVCKRLARGNLMFNKLPELMFIWDLN